MQVDDTIGIHCLQGAVLHKFQMQTCIDSTKFLSSSSKPSPLAIGSDLSFTSQQGCFDVSYGAIIEYTGYSSIVLSYPWKGKSAL